MAKPQRPGKKRLDLVRQALPKAHTQRTAAEKRAIRLTKAWRQAHPNWNKGGGGGSRGGLGQQTAASGLLTNDQINALAGQMAQDAILPDQQAIQRQQDQLAQSGAQQQALLGNLTQELGGLTANIAPSIQTAYRQAANDQANWAQGFSGGMEQIASAEADRNAAQLAQLGAPVEQIAQIQNQGQGAGNVLYGQGGYLPATSLGQQGAAFEAFGAQMPGIVARMGQQDIADAQANLRASQKDLAGRAADIAAQLPSLRRQYVQTLLGNEMDKLSLSMAMKELGLKAQGQAFEQDLATAQFNQDVATAGQPEPPSPSEILSRQKARGAYQKDLGGTMIDVLNTVIENNRRPATEGKGRYTDEHGIHEAVPAKPAETDTDVKKRLTYGKVFKNIYSQLAAMYGKGPKKWQYGVTDAKVRQMIRNFLAKQGIRPKRKVDQSILTGGQPEPTGSGYIGPGV